ncbi:MAG: serine/threonine protein kinase [Myxococcales bacterium]|nr:serine/threonine protein kinase [Myxococcales bacterium]
MALHCLENRVYDLKLEDGRHIVAKFYRPGRWSRETILDEHRFLRDLLEAEVPAAAPLAFPDGDTLHNVEEIHYAVWLRAGGRSPEELTDDQLAVLGRLLARLHNVGAGSPAPHRRRLSLESHLREPLEILERGFLPPTWSRRYRAAAERIGRAWAKLEEKHPFHRIHGDCHHGNLLFGRDGWFFLDFDDMVTGPAVQDLWLLVPGRDHEAERQRGVFLEGYRQFRDFETSWLRAIEALRGLRYVFYAGWVARRWSDPAFPSSFPHFNTEAYWEKETLDLEEQALAAEVASES